MKTETLYTKKRLETVGGNAWRRQREALAECVARLRLYASSPRAGFTRKNSRKAGEMRLSAATASQNCAACKALTVASQEVAQKYEKLSS